MQWTTALLVALALVGAATAIGLALRARSGRIVRTAGGRADASVSAVSAQSTDATDAGLASAAATLRLDADAFGADATLVQFSTAFCSRCPGTARQLGALAADSPGVRHVEIDLTDDPELAARHSVLQTPTTLVIDGAGRTVARIGGPPRMTELAELVDSLTRRTRATI
ncbi:thioredoxin family protein [Agromyces mediolanus]|uniref:TlpA family protein disulfide reductase n=1 Tax=Agromyces mediolanus TaxID=41986 RepID=UPI003834A019